MKSGLANLGLREIEQAIHPLDLSERQSSLLGEMLRPEELPRLNESRHFSAYLDGLRLQAREGPAEAFQPLRFSVHLRNRQVGDRDGSFGKVYFGRHYTLTALVLTTLVDETEEHLATIEDLLWLICNEYTWATSNHLRDGYQPDRFVDLFAAETAQMLAEVVTLLRGRLHGEVEDLVRRRVEERVLRPVFNDARPFWWEAVANNWAAVCSGSVGIAALLLERDRARLCGMLRRIFGAMTCFLDGFPGDGGCEEGIAYWNYGFGFYVYFAESLRVFSGGAIDLLSETLVGEGIRRIAEFPARIALSKGTFLNYSDALVDMPLAPGLLSRIHRRLGVEIPRPEKLPDYPGRTSTPRKWAHVSRTLCWTEESLFGRHRPTAGTVFFPDLGWVLDRRYADGAEGLLVAFSAKGGHNLESHNHNDLGHFILHVGGENLLADLGQGRYGQGYNESLNKTSEGHSVPRINGRGQPRGRKYRAEIVDFQEPAGDEPLRFALDLTRAYPSGQLQRFIRAFAWHPPGKDGSPAVLSLHDSFRFSSSEPGTGTDPGNAVEEFLISFQKPELGNGVAVWTGAGGRVELQFDPIRLIPSVEELEVILGNAGQKQVCYRLQLAVRDLQVNDEVRLRFVASLGAGGSLVRPDQ